MAACGQTSVSAFAADVEMPVILPNQREQKMLKVTLRSPNKQPWTVAQEKARLLGSTYKPKQYRMIVRPCTSDPGDKVHAQQTVMRDNKAMVEYQDLLSGGLIFFQMIGRQSSPGAQAKPAVAAHEAEMDFHYDMPVILPNQQQYTLLEVRMIAANNQPWTVSQEKARLLGSGYDATLFHLAFRPFNLDSGAVDQATVMDDNACMSEYSNSLSGSLLFFKPIEQ